MLTRCIFCDIVSGKADGLIITENEHALAVLDAFPLVSGHTLILSKKHCEKVQDLNQNELVSLVNLLSKVTSAVENGAQAKSTLIAIHNGKEAGQEIPHLHIHVVPRKMGDGGGPIHSCFRSSSSSTDRNLNEIFQKIKDSLF